MKPALRWGLSAALAGVLLLAAWRLVGQMQAELDADEAPGHVLAWRQDDPTALLRASEQALAAGDLVAATHVARQLLAHAPLTGQAYRVLGAAADAGGQPQQAQALFDIATRLAPRDLQTHSWLAQTALRQHRYPDALRQLDFVLRQQPDRFARLGPILAQLANDPAFADALAASLRDAPPWRAAMLQALQAPGGQTSQAQARVMQALQAQGGLSAAEFGLWLDSLMAQGRWGEAFARWAGTVVGSGGHLPLLYNGDFRLPISQTGFDWRQQDRAGVLLNVQADAADGQPGMHLQVLDRGIPDVGLEHVLLLTPGHYRLSMRLRAQTFASALGLHWVIDCDRGKRIVVQALPADGSFDWRDVAGEFEIPDTGCQGQRLRLINPVSGGAGQRVSGQLWFARMRIEPIAKRVLHAGSGTAA